MPFRDRKSVRSSVEPSATGDSLPSEASVLPDEPASSSRKSGRHRRVNSALAVVATLSGLILGFCCSGSLPEVLLRLIRLDGVLAVTATVEGGTAFSVFVDGSSVPLVVPIVPGVRHEYRFAGVPPIITSLRFDPTDRVNMSFRIERVALELDGAVADERTTADITGWPRAGITTDADGTMRSSNDDPIIAVNFSRFGLDPSRRSDARFAASAPLLFLGAALLIFFCGGSQLRLLIVAGGALGSVLTFGKRCAEIAAAEFTDFAPPSIREAVGNAAFIAHSKWGEQAAFIVLLGIGVGTSLLLLGLERITLRRRFFGLNGRSAENETDTYSTPPFPMFAFAATILAFAFILLPRFDAIRPGVLLQHPSIGDFDWRNFFIWDYLAQYGFLPHRDFWFPYGNTAMQMGPLASSAASLYWSDLVLIAGWLLVAILWSGNRYFVALGSTALLVVLSESGLIQAARRYLALVVGIALIGFLLRSAATSRMSGKDGSGSADRPRTEVIGALTGIWLGWIFWREPNQLLYVAPGGLMMAFVWAIRELRAGAQWRYIFSVLLPPLGIVFCAVALELATFAYNGQLAGFLHFLRFIGSTSAFSALAVDVPSWSEPALSAESLAFLSMIALFAAGATFLSERTVALRDLGLTICAVGITVLVMYQKMLIRPHMASQLLTPLAGGAVLLALGWSRIWPLRTKIAAACIVGMLVGLIPRASPGHPLTLVDRYRPEPSTIPRNLADLLSGAHMSRPELDAYFSAARFADVPPDLAELVRLLEREALPEFSHAMYVFGDDSYLYAFLKTLPCPHTTFYDASARASQDTVIRCLQSAPPRIVIVSREQGRFDSVPNSVRVPLIFEYIVTRFVPSRTIGRFEILRPRGEESVPLDFWSSLLGTEVDLGFLPAYTDRGTENDSCEHGDMPEHRAAGRACFDLVIDRPCTGSSICNRNLAVEIDHHRFTVSYRLLPGQTPAINLNRLWFWSAGASGERTITRSDGNPVPVVHHLLDSRILY